MLRMLLDICKPEPILDVKMFLACVPHGGPELISYGMIIVFTFGLIFHWFRRARRHPAPTEPLTGEIKGDILLFDKVQRVFHWATTVSYIFVVITGVALYDPFAFEPITATLRVPLHGSFPTYVLIHVVFSGALALLLTVHIIWDVGKLRRIRLMLPTKTDFKDTVIRAKSLLLGTRHYPRINKYDSFMRSYHLYLPIALLILAITGAYQLLYAPWWLVPLERHFEIEPSWRPTLLHDLFGFLLIALVFAHTYFAILPVNQSIFKAMLRGTITATEAAKKFRPEGLPSQNKKESDSIAGKNRTGMDA